MNWPAGFEPERACVHVVNATRAAGSPDRLWPWLAYPCRWSSYYVNARRVRPVDGPWPELMVGSRFRWWTFGLLITSAVTECEPNRRLAWTWSGSGAHGHHGFVLDGDEAGTVIHTEETVKGIAPCVVRPLLRPVMLYFHQRWIDGLARLAPGPTP